MTTAPAHKLVRLPNGLYAVFSENYGEKMHPGPGPAEEAEKVHVGQLRIQERLRKHTGEFVVWDVGLGAGANALTVLRCTRSLSCSLRLVSFDDTLEPLSFALENAEALGYLRSYEEQVKALIQKSTLQFADGAHEVIWELRLADFPSLLKQREAASLPKPDAILFDPFSPARNPGMWTLPVFENLLQLLDPSRPCALTTYSRSTMIRVTLLLAGLFVGRGRPTGLKEETTVAASTPALLDEPLDGDWLQRARKSASAEPLTTRTYSQRPLSPETWEQLRRHAQFS